MKRITSKLTGAFVLLLLLAAAAATANSQPRQKSLDRPVPNVVDLPHRAAEDALYQAGFKSKSTYLDEPDPSVLYGHVKATVPAAGTLLRPGSVVELQFPRAASRVGIGALSVSDFERRAGFDLDEGRYEEIYRGADIVLRKYESEPRIINGRTYHGVAGVYIEPSDGAFLATFDNDNGFTNEETDLGSFGFYEHCVEQLSPNPIYSNPTPYLARRTKILVGPGGYNGSYLTFCVWTSKQQVAVVQFRDSSETDYQFHYAIFPRQLILPRASASLKNDSPSVFEKKVDINALAAKGEAIANPDPLAVELRNRQPEGPTRRGFDIGMAAAEGQTAPGPAKQRIHDSLSPEQQGGFDTAVAFSLERNRNADLAAKGAAIAAADPVVAEARTAETDVFYWLGFDIATGIFGDPALGARGNTATGPGSLKIRDSLSAAGQRGFNAAVKLHLSRNYKP